MCWCLCLTQFEWGQRGNESETEIPNEMRGNQRWTRRPHALPAAAARFVDAFERVSNDVGTPRCRRRRYPADRFYDLMRTRRDAGATRKSSPRPQSCAAPVVSRRLGPRLRPADRPKSAAPSQFAPLNNKSINSATVFQFFFRARRGALGFTRWKNLKCDTKESISVFFCWYNSEWRNKISSSLIGGL